MKKTVERRKTTVPVRNHTDVLVIGAGPAGFGAAVAAARAGAKVTLIERSGMAGGMWTLGLLSPFFDNSGKDGLNRELRDELKKRHSWGGLWDISFDPTEMTMLLDEYIVSHNIDLLLYTFFVETVFDGNQITGVIAENKSGVFAVTADWVIDCTGDGDAAADAGAEFELGREGDHFCQPMTMMFRLGGVKDDYPRDGNTLWFEKLVERAGMENLLSSIPFSSPACIKLPRPGEALIQWTHIQKHSGIGGDDLTRATLEGRKQVREAMKFMPLIEDIFGKVYLLQLPWVIGVRESRRIIGEYRISDDDVKNSARFSDAVCRVEFNVDIHEPDVKGQQCIDHHGFDIPMRALIPRGKSGLLTAGRCISGSFMAHAAYRVTGNCLAMGEAAGKFAAENR